DGLLDLVDVAQRGAERQRHPVLGPVAAAEPAGQDLALAGHTLQVAAARRGLVGVDLGGGEDGLGVLVVEDRAVVEGQSPGKLLVAVAVLRLVERGRPRVERVDQGAPVGGAAVVVTAGGEGGGAGGEQDDGGVAHCPSIPHTERADPPTQRVDRARGRGRRPGAGSGPRSGHGYAWTFPRPHL